MESKSLEAFIRKTYVGKPVRGASASPTLAKRRSAWSSALSIDGPGVNTATMIQSRLC